MTSHHLTAAEVWHQQRVRETEREERERFNVNEKQKEKIPNQQ